MVDLLYFALANLPSRSTRTKALVPSKAMMIILLVCQVLCTA